MFRCSIPPTLAKKSPKKAFIINWPLPFNLFVQTWRILFCCNRNYLNKKTDFPHKVFSPFYFRWVYYGHKDWLIARLTAKSKNIHSFSSHIDRCYFCQQKYKQIWNYRFAGKRVTCYLIFEVPKAESSSKSGISELRRDRNLFFPLLPPI